MGACRGDIVLGGSVCEILQVLSVLSYPVPWLFHPPLAMMHYVGRVAWVSFTYGVSVYHARSVNPWNPSRAFIRVVCKCQPMSA